jgi:hydroxymethylbilane synthase
MIADRVARLAGATVELVRIRTEGDVNTGPLATIGGTGVFVTGVREALLDGRADIVVHSYKDLPTAPTEGITVAAVPERESPFDALCARDGLRLDDLPRGSTVGTGSPRRAAQLLARRPDLAVVPIRGNVDTRLRQVSEGHLDAVVLAAAGLNRLGRADAITDVLDADRMLPAPAQGALAVECRSGADTWFTEATRTLDDAPTRAAVVAERVLLRDLEAGCSAPVGAFAQVQGDALTLRAVVVAVDGGSEFRVHRAGSPSAAADLGARAAADLIGQGAAGLLGAR